MPDASEIFVHLEYIRKGIDGLTERLDVQNGHLRRHGEAIAVLHARSQDARKSGAKWGGIIGGAIAGAAAVWQFVQGGK